MSLYTIKTELKSMIAQYEEQKKDGHYEYIEIEPVTKCEPFLPNFMPFTSEAMEQFGVYLANTKDPIISLKCYNSEDGDHTYGLPTSGDRYKYIMIDARWVTFIFRIRDYFEEELEEELKRNHTRPVVHLLCEFMTGETLDTCISLKSLIYAKNDIELTYGPFKVISEHGSIAKTIETLQPCETRIKEVLIYPTIHLN